MTFHMVGYSITSSTCLEVEHAERDEGQQAGDDQLGEVVVPEYVVQVHSQAGSTMLGIWNKKNIVKRWL